MWKKNHFANALIAKDAPLSYFEDMSVFFKRYDTSGKHPLRDYFSEVLQYIGMTSCKQVNDALGHRRAEHTFYVSPRKKILIPSAEKQTTPSEMEVRSLHFVRLRPTRN